MVIVRAGTKRLPGLVHRAELGSTGWDRSRAWTCVFSSTHSTTARSGGLWYRPATSMTFSTNGGSVLSLKPSVRCGLSSNLRQIRPIVESDRPPAEFVTGARIHPFGATAVGTRDASPCMGGLGGLGWVHRGR